MKELGYEAVDESLEETESHYYKSYEAMENYCQTSTGLKFPKYTHHTVFGTPKTLAKKSLMAS